MNRRFRQYNLVEVILALGVVAIGVVSIMALFPIGSAATRDAAMETFSSNAADEVCHMVEYLAIDDWNNWIRQNTIIPSAKPSDPGADTATTSANDWQALPSRIRGIDTNIFRHASTAGVFLLISHHDTGANISNGLQDVDAEKIDYKAVVQVWKERIREEPNEATGANDIPLDDAARLFVEVSWPEEMQYESRQKRFFSYDIVNPDGGYERPMP